MKNLELNACGIQEMDTLEMKQTDGGLVFWAVVGAGLLVAAGAAIINDWDDFKDGFASAF
ncbi:MAG TPA: hypothetical protein DCG75_00100 [Bacteroidales bacterium]|nr:hypothetical protein [Bacteroidales bacterium]